MKKVLFTSHTANFQKFNHPFMKWFKQQGYEVHYASMGEEWVLHCDKHHTICFSRSPFSIDNIKAYKPLKKIIDTEDYEIIHTHTPMGSVVTRLAARKARKNGTKVIYTAHGFHFYKGAPPQNWAIYYPIEKLLSRYTDVLITINTEDYDLAKKSMKARQIVKINGVGVDLKKFKPIVNSSKKIELRKQYGYSPDDLILICVAELNGNKNQEFLIKCIKDLSSKHPNIKLLLCGEGGFREKYLQLINEYKLENNIQLLGYRKDIAKLMQLSDIGVSASLREGLPLNVLEELATGLPVLASSNRGHKDIVSSIELGYLYTTNNKKEFFDIFYKMINSNYTELNQIRNKATHKYSIAKAISSLQPIYFSNKLNETEDVYSSGQTLKPTLNLQDQAAFFSNLQNSQGSIRRIRRIVKEQNIDGGAYSDDQSQTTK